MGWFAGAHLLTLAGGAGVEGPVGGGRPLNVLAHVSHAWPQQRGGSETSLHRTLQWLAARGHRVQVIVTTHRGYRTDGVYYRKLGIQQKHQWWDWADVAITQQGGTGQAVRFAEEHHKPLVAYCHNLAYLDGHPELDPDKHTLIANTRASLADLDWSGRVFVLHPPVFASEWDGRPGDRITQVNVSALKGGAFFWDLARARPDRKFLAVVGGWGEQLHPNGNSDDSRDADRTLPRDTLANVAVVPGTTNMLADVYARTRVLVIPTAYVNPKQNGESYGIVAAEAIASGIPVIAYRSPGMEELLGDAGHLMRFGADIGMWLDLLDELDDPDRYAGSSSRARARARELDPIPELIGFEALLRDLAPERAPTPETDWTAVRRSDLP